jgi:hypothetical protein
MDVGATELTFPRRQHTVSQGILHQFTDHHSASEVDTGCDNSEQAIK